jgi:hypothetical protein
MIVTTCGAACDLSALILPALGGEAGRRGEGAGVCAATIAHESSAAQNVVTLIALMTVISILPARACYQTRFCAN